jgi:hypothetical protein
MQIPYLFSSSFFSLIYALVDNSCPYLLRMSGSFQEQFLFVVSCDPTKTSPDYTELLSRCRIFIVNLKIDITVRICTCNCSFLPTRLHKLHYRQRNVLFGLLLTDYVDLRRIILQLD